MTILDVNGNTLKTGKPACNWFQKHKRLGNIAEFYLDGAGRMVCTFKNGNCAMFFPQDEHRNIMRGLEAEIAE